MSKYRKKPVVVDAWQWNGDPTQASILVPSYVRENARPRPEDPSLLIVSTPEGEMTTSPGDWIIRGVEGEVYPCKPSVFDATYEPVSEDEEARDD